MRPSRSRQLTSRDALAFARQPPRLPNFFILGAAKCGTTSMHHYLDQHPAVFMSPDKEPQFFVSQGQLTKGLVEYLHLFSTAGDAPILGESSHAYMTSPESAPVLHLLAPDAKFLVILRDPVDRAYSHYVHMRRHGFEKLPTFEQALDAEDARFRSEDFATKAKDYRWNYFYRRTGMYGEQIQRYFELFSPEQFMFLQIADLKTDPLTTCNAVFDFLGQESLDHLDDEPQNVGSSMARFPAVNTAGRALVQRSERLLKVGWALSQKLNSVPPETVDPAVRAGLNREFLDDLQLTFELTGVDLRPGS